MVTVVRLASRGHHIWNKSSFAAMDSNEILNTLDRLEDELEHPPLLDECIINARVAHLEETKILCRYTSGYKIDNDAKPRGLYRCKRGWTEEHERYDTGV